MTKRAIITGASGGLGKEVSRLLIREGYQVTGVDIQPPCPFYNGQAGFGFHQTDVTSADEVDRLAEKFGREKGLDLLVCLAGVYDTFPVTEGPAERFTGMFQVNVFSVALFIQAFLKPLIINKGRVIVVSSESYKVQALFQPYMVTKSALEAYCRAAWQELALKGVGLCVIRPGAIRTPLLRWMEHMEIRPDSEYYNEYETSYRISRNMVGKITSPEVVARKILKAAVARNPGRYYRVNNNPLLTLAALLPAAWLEGLVVRLIRKRTGANR